MCDTADDMDEYIEYEFARDCIEIADDDENNRVVGHQMVNDDNQILHVAQSEYFPADGFVYEDDDYEIVEELEDEVDQVLLTDPALDIKTEILEQTDEEEQHELKKEFIEEDHLIDEDTGNSYERQVGVEEDDIQNVEYEELALEEHADLEDDVESVIPDKQALSKSIKPKKTSAQPCSDDKNPGGVAKKYMLYDELVATVVDYDTDGTPIVEFSVSHNDTDEKLPMECGICPDVMSRGRIPTHLKTHLVPGTNRYQCIYCEETYKDCKYLAGHARRHMGIRPYVCELCKLYFSTKQDLRVHNQRRHQEKDHICEMCGKTFAQNTQLKRHREATHEKKRRFKCDVCPKSYYKNFSLQEHIRAVHMGKRRIIVCPFCGMQCRDAHKMARHRKQFHLNQTHFKCKICNEEFTDINYFDAHKRSIQCRNNTRRKLEEEQQQEEEQLQQQLEMQQVDDPTNEILLEGDVNSQQYSQNSNEHQSQSLLQQLPANDDMLETVQTIDECVYKHLMSTSPHHQVRTGQFIINNDFLQHHKIEEISAEDVAEDDELVYEITIDSNE